MFWPDQQVVMSHPTSAGDAIDRGAEPQPYGEQKAFQSGSCRISQEQWKVVDNEVIIIRTTDLAGKPIVFKT